MSACELKICPWGDKCKIDFKPRHADTDLYIFKPDILELLLLLIRCKKCQMRNCKEIKS